MLTRLMRLSVWSLSVLMISASAFGQMGQRQAPRVIEFNNPTAAAGPIQVAVLGQIAKPGVYQFPGKVTLSQLIQTAEGVSPTAAASVRLIRQGRTGQRLSMEMQKNTPLMPNDLIVVDQDPERKRQAMISSGKVLAPEPEGISLAFLGVLDRPVVVMVRPSEANIPTLMSMLAQAPTAMAGVHVLEANRQNLGPTNDLRQLPDGTVLMFDRRYMTPIKPEAFPAVILPASETATDVVQRPADIPVQTLPYRQGEFGAGALAANRGGEMGEDRETLIGLPGASTSTQRLPGVSGDMVALPVRPRNGSDTMAMAPQTIDGDLSARNMSLSNSRGPSMLEFGGLGSSSLVPTPEPMTNMAPSQPMNGMFDSGTESDLETMNPPSPAASVSPPMRGPLSLSQMMLIVTMVTGLVGMAIVVRHITEQPNAQGMARTGSHARRDSLSDLGLLKSSKTSAGQKTMGATMASGSATAEDQTLNRLLMGEMGLVEEDCLIPAGLRFHQEAARERVARVDTAAAAASQPMPQRPHFAADSTIAAPAEMESTIASEKAAMFRIDRATNRSRQEPHFQPGLSEAGDLEGEELRTALDRALTRLHSGAGR